MKKMMVAAMMMVMAMALTGCDSINEKAKIPTFEYDTDPNIDLNVPEYKAPKIPEVQVDVPEIKL